MARYFEYRNKNLYAHHTYSEHPVNEIFPMHAHETLELYYFISGSCRYLVEGNEYFLKPGNVMIMRPSETHNLCVLEDVPYERFAIHINPGLYKAFDPDGLLLKPFYDRPLGRLNRYSEEQFPSSLYKYCFESISADSPLGNKLEVESKLFTLLGEVLKAYSVRVNEQYEENDENSDVSVKLINYINNKLYEPLSLSELSDVFFLSQSQLNRIFRKSTGTSVWEYITIKRLLSARNLIRHGEPAGKVCTVCGFNDYSSFYRMYKSRFGVSPKQDGTYKSVKE